MDFLQSCWLPLCVASTVPQMVPYWMRCLDVSQVASPDGLSTVEKICGSVGAVLRANHASADHFPGDPENEKPAG